MGRELRIVGFVVLAAIAFSLLDIYNKQSAKPMSMSMSMSMPMPMPLPIADETKPEPSRTVRVIQIYKTPSDQLPADTTPGPIPVEPISAFPETTTSPLPSPSPSPPPQKTAAGFCEQFHMHKVFTKNGKSWRCVR
jgi:predicted component of type VI protein secretion system